METAINIGFACSLLQQGMRQINISAQNICIDLRAVFALIIDGKALAYALEDDMKFKFLKLAVNCASVTCCRVSPKQKALFPALYQQGPKNLFFDWTRILGIFYDQAFASNGQTSVKCIIGTAMFTSIIWTVNIQIFLMMNHFTWIQHATRNTVGIIGGLCLTVNVFIAMGSKVSKSRNSEQKREYGIRTTRNNVEDLNKDVFFDSKQWFDSDNENDYQRVSEEFNVFLDSSSYLRPNRQMRSRVRWTSDDTMIVDKFPCDETEIIPIESCDNITEIPIDQQKAKNNHNQERIVQNYHLMNNWQHTSSTENHHCCCFSLCNRNKSKK
ncbi:hypothetical protein ZOSMA_286G00150 [Zostera marina]|uniref:Uncharacterized protein n=1 Tax=Zostera marina TaxID=29655 RepID=A0A0K9PF47_ZOSMR|nr:hypothetical protein ZOSMA_286G00150 [Zostera marina]